MIILTYDGQFHGVVKHISQRFGRQKTPSNQGMFRRIPKRIILLIKSRNDTGLEILLGHVFYDIVTIG